MEPPPFLVTYRLMLADFTALMDSRYRINDKARRGLAKIKTFALT